MECVDVETRLSALLDGELEDAQEVEQHLAACDSCRRKRTLLAAIQAAVRRLPGEAVSEGFTVAAGRRIDAERRLQEAPRRPLTRRPALLAGALAAALFLSVWTSTHWPSRAHPTSPPAGAMAPEAWPGLDCRVQRHEPPIEAERPCSSAATCGPMRVLPDSLARRQPVCTQG